MFTWGLLVFSDHDISLFDVALRNNIFGHLEFEDIVILALKRLGDVYEDFCV